MPAKSKKQQRFMGMVHAVQKGEMEAPSEQVADAAKSMKKDDAKHYAETKHKGLPEKVKESRLKIAAWMVRYRREHRPGEKEAVDKSAWLRTASRFYRGEPLIPAIRAEYPQLNRKEAVDKATAIVRLALKVAAEKESMGSAVAAAPSMSYNGPVSSATNILQNA